MEYAFMIPGDFTPAKLAMKLEMRYEMIEKLFFDMLDEMQVLPPIHFLPILP